MIYNLLKNFILLFLTFNLFSYNAKVIFIDSNFKNLKNNKIEKIIYLSSEISFDIKKGETFNLYRNIDNILEKKINSYTDLNKGSIKNKDDFKKICVIRLKVVSVIKNLIKAVEYGDCKNRKKDDYKLLGEFQLSKIGDFIEIKTIFDKKSEKTVNGNRFSDIIATMYMIGIDEDFNYLLESGIKGEVNKVSDSDKGLLNKPGISKGEKYKKLPEKKKKSHKKKRNKKANIQNFEKIRL